MQIVLLAAVTILTAGWFALTVRYGNSFTEIIETIDEEIYQVPELFFIGFGLMELFHFNMRSNWARKRIREFAETNGKKYAEYYFYVTVGAEITYGYTLLVLLWLFAAISQTMFLALLGAVLAVLVVFYEEEQVNNKISDRRDELLADFPQVLSKLTLLVNSGMVMRDAWAKVAATGERAIYQEMKITMQEFHNGVSELEAYRNFADRCAIKEIRRFSSTMIQNLQKGNAEIAFFLREMADEMWEEKKHLAKRKGEAANAKLMIPTALIFVGILIMIMVPAFGGM